MTEIDTIRYERDFLMIWLEATQPDDAIGMVRAMLEFVRKGEPGWREPYSREMLHTLVACVRGSRVGVPGLAEAGPTEKEGGKPESPSDEERFAKMRLSG